MGNKCQLEARTSGCRSTAARRRQLDACQTAKRVLPLVRQQSSTKQRRQQLIAQQWALPTGPRHRRPFDLVQRVLHLSVLQAQLVAELGRMRGALLLAFPDQGRALHEHGMPPKDIGAASVIAFGEPSEAGDPLYSAARHREWVQVGIESASREVRLLCSERAVLFARQSTMHVCSQCCWWHSMWTAQQRRL
jgi:hypothetical protein